MRYNQLTKEQIKFIIENHTVLKYREIAEELGISKSKVVAQTQYLQEQGVLGKKPRRINWTKEQEQRIIELVQVNSDVSFLSKMLNKNTDEIIAKLRNLKQHELIQSDTIISRPKRKNSFYCAKRSQWENEKIELLKQNLKTHSLYDLTTILEKTTYDIISKSRELMEIEPQKISIYMKHFINDFTQEQDDFLIDNYKNEKREIIINFFHDTKTWKQIQSRMRLFGITRKWYRSCETPSDEIIMMKLLKEIGIPYKHQKRINYDGKRFYIVDFLLYDNVVIEVFGDFWHGNPIRFPKLSKNQQQKKKRDLIRQKKLQQLGYKVYIFWEYDLINNYNDCKNRIVALLPR
jgi:G:T-mismatch repair DNA endonuclease (very short patch repair protein)/predicted ArsR family transcriptional regulator